MGRLAALSVGGILLPPQASILSCIAVDPFSIQQDCLRSFGAALPFSWLDLSVHIPEWLDFIFQRARLSTSRTTQRLTSPVWCVLMV
jgi:hypothetical protein